MTRLIDELSVGNARDAEITVGGWEDVPDSALERTGRAGRLIGKMIGLATPREIKKQLTMNVIANSPVLSQFMRPDPADPGAHAPEPGRPGPGRDVPGRYVPGPGREPAPAEVIVDADLAERMPWLIERPPLPPGMPQSALRTFSFDVQLDEDDGTVIVSAFDGRIGTLNGKDASEYVPHIRSGRAQDKTVTATATGRVIGRRSLRVTVRLEGSTSC
jgi:hypothetical protein